MTRRTLAVAALAALATSLLAGCSASPAASPSAISSPTASATPSSAPSPSESPSPVIAEPLPLAISSSDFVDGSGLASTFAGGQGGCPGDNLSPQLTWEEGPAGTVTYAISVTDADAANFTHWLHYNIPADITSVGRGGGAELAGTEGRNSLTGIGYFGPCPPSGAHHYVFTVYALDTTLAPETVISWPEFAFVHSKGHVLAQGQITGIYPNPAG